MEILKNLGSGEWFKILFAITICGLFVYWLIKELINAPKYEDLWGPDPYKELTPKEAEILKLKKMEEDIRDQLKRVEVLIKKKESRLNKNI